MAKRYVTIDFLRGLAIVLMIYIHTQMKWIDQNYYFVTLAKQPFFNLFALVAATFFGAWCGFFLLISAIGNMISIQKGLQAGQSPLQVGFRQVVGGVILLIFAWLTESITGYQSAAGIIVEQSVDPSMLGTALLGLFSLENIFYAVMAIVVTLFINAVIVFILMKNEKESKPMMKYPAMICLVLLLSSTTILAFAVGVYGIPEPVLTYATDGIFSRGFAVNETIHAVAYCVIITGIVQAILSINGGFKKVTRNVIIYAILAILVIIFTPFVWKALFPYKTGEIGVTPVLELIWTWALHAYDGFPEPLFPFLAEAFIGAILGIWLTQERPNRKVIKYGLWACLILFWVGLAGTMMVAVSGDMTYLGKLMNYFWSLVHMGVDTTLPGLQGDFIGISSIWFWWFMCLTAAQVASVLLLVRMIEFRGRGQALLKGTQWVRRFGFVAFTVYNYQFFDVPVAFLFSLLPNVPDYNYGAYMIQDPMIWPLIVLIFLWWNLILILWEKVDYVFSMEWFIAKLAGLIIPSKRETTKLPWWRMSRLDAKSQLINIEPIDFVKAEDVDHEHFKDSLLAFKLAIMGFIFFPLTIASYVVVRQAQKSEKPNPKLKAANIMALIQFCLIAISITVSLFISIYSLTGMEVLF